MFIPGIFFGGREFSPSQKKLTIPQKAAKFCALNLFFGRDNELQIYHGNCLLMDNQHRKLFVTKQSKRASLCLIAQNYVWRPDSTQTFSSPFLRLCVRRRINHWSLWRMASVTPDLRLPSQPQGIAARWLVQIILFSDRGTRVWTTCPRSLPESGTAEIRTRDLLNRKSNAVTTTLPGHDYTSPV